MTLIDKAKAHDDDLIRRGDARAAVQAAYDDSDFEPDLADADARIAALPARGVGVPTERPDAPAHIVEYTNWRGETARRTIIPIRMWWGSTEWHPQEQWMLTAWDVEKNAARDFAWQDMRPVQNGATSAAVAAQRAALAPTDAAQAREAALREAAKAIRVAWDQDSDDVNKFPDEAEAAILALIGETRT